MEVFAGYESKHTRRTGLIVGPLMITEFLTALLLAVVPNQFLIPDEQAIGLVALGVIWISTALIQAPAHRRLMKGFDRDTIRLLVNTNWIRTAAWTARAAVMTVAVFRLEIVTG